MHKFYTVKEVAHTLRIHWQSVLNYIRDSKLEAVKLGKGYRISEKALEKFITDRTKGVRK